MNQKQPKPKRAQTKKSTKQKRHEVQFLFVPFLAREPKTARTKKAPTKRSMKQKQQESKTAQTIKSTNIKGHEPKTA